LVSKIHPSPTPGLSDKGLETALAANSSENKAWVEMVDQKSHVCGQNQQEK